MTHEEAREKLLDLAYGELGSAERMEVERHVSGCAGCTEELAAIARTRAAARLLPDPAPTGGREELLRAARKAVARSGPSARPRRSRPAAWMAAAAVVLAVGAVTLRVLDAGPRRETDAERVVTVAPAAPATAPEAAGATGAAPTAPAEPAMPAAPTVRRAPSSVSPPVASAAKSPAAPAPAGAVASREQAAEAGADAPAATARLRSAETAQAPAFPPGVSGAFVSLDLRTGKRFRVNPEACAARHSPFSTFKIPGSLIGLETGVVKGADERWRWDPARYPPPTWGAGDDYLRAWREDQSLRTALPRSIVWYFREVATRVGAPRMKGWLATFDYGNQDVSGGLDRFWLGSTLRISPDEQAEFLAKLQRGQFPVAPANLALVQELLTEESGAGHRLVAKTGSSGNGEGWLVGWVDVPGAGCTFALHLRTSSHEEMTRLRPGLARDFLRRAGCLPP